MISGRDIGALFFFTNFNLQNKKKDNITSLSNSLFYCQDIIYLYYDFVLTNLTSLKQI